MSILKHLNQPEARPRVLVVDDEIDFLKLIKDLLTGAGIPCAVASGVEEACSLLKREKFDFVLLDWKLEPTIPGRQGCEQSGAAVLEFCRKLDLLLPVVVMTSLPQNTLDVRSDALLAEADGFLEKGFGASVLTALVSRWLKRADATPRAFLPDRAEDVRPFKEYRNECIRHIVSLFGGNITLAGRALKMDWQTVSNAIKNSSSEPNTSDATIPADKENTDEQYH